MSQDDVERVGRALAANDAKNGRSPILHYEQYSEMWNRMARAALSAMPQRELRIGDFILRHSPNGIWIGRTDGEGGEFATEHVERVIAQFYWENF